MALGKLLQEITCAGCGLTVVAGNHACGSPFRAAASNGAPAPPPAPGPLRLARPPRKVVVDPGLGYSFRGFRSSRTAERPFAAHGYCFRCDTREPDSVCKYGFERLSKFNPPPEIPGTIIHRFAFGIRGPRQLLMWKENRDAFSELTICVARQLRG